MQRDRIPPSKLSDWLCVAPPWVRSYSACYLLLQAQLGWGEVRGRAGLAAGQTLHSNEQKHPRVANTDPQQELTLPQPKPAPSVGDFIFYFIFCHRTSRLMVLPQMRNLTISYSQTFYCSNFHISVCLVLP